MNQSNALILPAVGEPSNVDSGSLFFVGTATVILQYAGFSILTTRFCLYITGDTLIIEQLKEIPKRYPNIDLALLHLGGTKIFGVLLTMDAKQGVEAIQIIAPHTAIPIHYNDYTVFKSPLEDFVAAVTAAGLENKVKYLNHGDTYQFEVAAARV